MFTLIKKDGTLNRITMVCSAVIIPMILKDQNRMVQCHVFPVWFEQVQAIKRTAWFLNGTIPLSLHGDRIQVCRSQ